MQQCRSNLSVICSRRTSGLRKQFQFKVSMESDNSTVTVVCALVFALGVIFWLFRMWMQGTFYSRDTRVDGKVVLITGANTGIGFYTAIELVRRGAKVYIACRSPERGEPARLEIIKQSASSNVHFLQLDLASMKSIRAFVERFQKDEHKLDILINNAGIFACPESHTEDGFETQFGVNHLGHFLLTNLLLEQLKRSSEPARVINVSSFVHTKGQIKRNDLMSRNHYDAFAAYTQSKLANVIFTKELARRFKPQQISSFTLNPGVINTEVFRHVNDRMNFMKPLGRLTSFLFFKTPEAGIQTILYCALEPGLEAVSGQYFDNCKQVKANPLADDEDLGSWLWSESAKLVQLT